MNKIDEKKLNKIDGVKLFVNANAFSFAFIYFLTEGLSAFGALTRKNCLIAWGLVLIILSVFLVVTWCRKGFSAIRIGSNKEGYSIVWWIIIVISIIISMIILFLAIRIVPYNYDSMVYHCSRIMNWDHNRSVDYYVTNNGRQLFSPAFAEYVMLQTYYILGSDKGFNLVQWYGYIVSALMSYFCLNKLGVKRELSAMGMLLVLSAPIIIAEGTTTQSDLFASIWVVLSLYLLIDLVEKEHLSFDLDTWSSVLSLATFLGLGYLSKTQVILPIGFLILWMLVNRIIKRDKVEIISVYTIVAGVVAIVPFLTPLFKRNYGYTGDIFASSYYNHLSIGTYKPNYVIINILKNWAQSSVTYSNITLNHWMDALICRVAGLLGVYVDDNLINVTGRICFSEYIEKTVYSCDNASAPFIGWLFAICILVWVIGAIRTIIKKDSSKTFIGLEIVLAISALAVMGYIKWQPWVTRLLIPVYLCMVIFSVLVISNAIEYVEKRDLMNGIGICLAGCVLYASMPAIDYQKDFYDRYLECGDRNRMYFAVWDRYDQYNEMIEYAAQKNYTDIGMYIDGDTYEYPLWVMCKPYNMNLIQTTGGAMQGNATPECVFAIRMNEYEIGEMAEFVGKQYVCTYRAEDDGAFAVLERIE